MTTSKANWRRVRASQYWLGLGLMTSVAFGTWSIVHAQELNGKLVLDQSQTGAVVSTNNVVVEDFSGSSVLESTLATGNNIQANLVDGGALLHQLQLGNTDAQSFVVAGKGYYLRDTALSVGNAISLSGDGNIDENTASIDQTSSGQTNAGITLSAGAIEFYEGLLDSSGNDATLTSDEFRSQFVLRQSNSGNNLGALEQTGGVARAGTQFVVSGNKANFNSAKQLPARAPAYRP